MKQNEIKELIKVYRLPPDRFPPKISPSSESEIGKATDYLQQSFDELLSHDNDLAKCIRRMQKSGLTAVVFGGWARDRAIEAIYHQKIPSRDIDLVAHGMDSVLDVLPETALINPFGGFGMEATSIHVDIWNLRDTFLIRRNNLAPKFDQLPLTADYTANALVFKPTQFFGSAEIIESGAINAIRQKELDFAADEVAQPKVQAARALILSTRLNFKLSLTVRQFIRVVITPPEARDAVIHGLKTYCPASLLSTAIELFSEIENEND